MIPSTSSPAADATPAPSTSPLASASDATNAFFIAVPSKIVIAPLDLWCSLAILVLKEHSAPDGYADFSLMIIMIRDNREHPRVAGSPSPAIGDMLARLFPAARRGHFLPATAHGLDNALWTGHPELVREPARRSCGDGDAPSPGARCFS